VSSEKVTKLLNKLLENKDCSVRLAEPQVTKLILRLIAISGSMAIINIVRVMPLFRPFNDIKTLALEDCFVP
jgi:hypothetical protein